MTFKPSGCFNGAGMVIWVMAFRRFAGAGGIEILNSLPDWASVP